MLAISSETKFNFKWRSKGGGCEIVKSEQKLANFGFLF